MDEFDKKQKALIDGIVKVFDENDADMFEAYRALYVMKQSLMAMMLEMLEESSAIIEELLEALEGESE